MGKKCWGVVAILLLVIAGGAYKFLFQGAVEQASDGRQAIMLTPPERDIVLAEMRAFLVSVQKISEGLTREDMAQVVTYARQVGRAAQQTVPGTLMGKLPLEFKQLGFETHSRFDQLALDAEQLEDVQYAHTQLAELMNNCVACHAAYRIDVAHQ